MSFWVRIKSGVRSLQLFTEGDDGETWQLLEAVKQQFYYLVQLEKEDLVQSSNRSKIALEILHDDHLISATLSIFLLKHF